MIYDDIVDSSPAVSMQLSFLELLESNEEVMQTGSLDQPKAVNNVAATDSSFTLPDETLTTVQLHVLESSVTEEHNYANGSTERPVCSSTPNGPDESPATKLYQNLSPIQTRAASFLQVMEEHLSTEEKMLFNKRFEQALLVHDDAAYDSWLLLKQQTEAEKEKRKESIRKICQANQTTSAARKELFKLPQKSLPAKRGSNSRKNVLPLNLSSNEALNILAEGLKQKETKMRQKQENKDKKRLNQLKKKSKSKTTLNKQKGSVNANTCASSTCKLPNVTKSVKWIACDLCDKWYHVQCTKLNQTLRDEDIQTMDWFCPECKSGSPTQ